MNALALYDELVDVDHLLGCGCPAEEPGSGGGGSEPPEMTESVSGNEIPERIESASLLLLARVVTSHEDASEWDRDLEEDSVVLLLVGVSSSCRDTCTHCDDCPWGALL